MSEKRNKSEIRKWNTLRTNPNEEFPVPSWSRIQSKQGQIMRLKQQINDIESGIQGLKEFIDDIYQKPQVENYTAMIKKLRKGFNRNSNTDPLLFPSRYVERID